TARSRRRRPRRRRAPPALRRRGRGLPRATPSLGPSRSRGTEGSRARSRTAGGSAAARPPNASRPNRSGRASAVESRSGVEEAVERLERQCALREVRREPVASEDPGRQLGHAAVREAVADVDEPPCLSDVGALALLPADLADSLWAEEAAPPLRPRVESIGEH